MLQVIPLLLRKTVGRYKLYERNPKPKGEKRYVVWCDDCHKDFRRYAIAVAWMKARTKKERICLKPEEPSF